MSAGKTAGEFLRRFDELAGAKYSPETHRAFQDFYDTLSGSVVVLLHLHQIEDVTKFFEAVDAIYSGRDFDPTIFEWSLSLPSNLEIQIALIELYKKFGGEVTSTQAGASLVEIDVPMEIAVAIGTFLDEHYVTDVATDLPVIDRADLGEFWSSSTPTTKMQELTRWCRLLNYQAFKVQEIVDPRSEKTIIVNGRKNFMDLPTATKLLKIVCQKRPEWIISNLQTEVQKT
jgi:hypothetical protein